VLCGAVFSVSCSRTSNASKSANTSPIVEEDTVVKQLQDARAENNILREENERLCSEIVRLNQELADASEAIYTLNRKLDAIFNPDVIGE
jgi:hypothetical protein